MFRTKQTVPKQKWDIHSRYIHVSFSCIYHSSFILHTDELRLFCHEDVLDTLTQENVIHLSQLKNEFADDVIEVDTKRLWDFFSEEAIEEKGAYYTNMQYHD